ncbi:DUF1772 domain-containing protein [Opitutus terrae]|uniref:Uncharacterized protein n=1 Tax=Opitutus terrae (strain DSM 11246 / JCM 15787 / PB90-1) TaxID=452637 RepID=B1ZNI6_OPITP|nr:DUF1772 domain-containing protein [Opitutus terrae]ACB74420.1 hypothetical protein Oter_1132 [Opitutus terrae PB90-1]
MKLSLYMLALCLGLMPLLALAQPSTTVRGPDRLTQLESRVHRLERSYKSLAGPAFLAGVIAALWAQNTRRNAWLWFILGALFVPITLIVLLYLNARDRRPPPSAAPSAPG